MSANCLLGGRVDISFLVFIWLCIIFVFQFWCAELHSYPKINAHGNSTGIFFRINIVYFFQFKFSALKIKILHSTSHQRQYTTSHNSNKTTNRKSCFHVVTPDWSLFCTTIRPFNGYVPHLQERIICPLRIPKNVQISSLLQLIKYFKIKVHSMVAI